MCNLSEGIEKRDISIGKAEERIDSKLESIRNLMDSCNWSDEQAMTALKISEGDWSKYISLLQKGPH